MSEVKILVNSSETRNYLDSLPRVYIAACWAGWGVRGFAFSGKYKDKEKTIPLVWDYYDFNGTADEWHRISIYDTTTGFIAGWSFNEEMLRDYTRLKNIERKEEWRNG